MVLLPDVDMIVLMMVLVTNYLQINLSRFLYLLFLFILVCCSNTEKQGIISNVTSENILHTEVVQNDSLEIIVENIPADKMVSFLYEGVDFGVEYVHFENKSDITKTISKKILKSTNFNFSLYYRTFSSINNKNISFYYDYFIDPFAHKINFIFDGKTGDIELKNHDGNVIKYDAISNEYEKINYKTARTTSSQKIKKLENLHSEYQKKFSDSTHLLINDLSFYTQLSLVSPNDKRIKNYLENITNPIWSLDLSLLVYFYLQANKDNIYLLNLNKSNNGVYNNLMDVGISWHLQQFKIKDKKYANYDKNLLWFKNTDYYKNNKIKLDKLLVTDEKPNSIKNELLSFDLHNDGKVVKLESIISNRESKYYLLDFWATWCIPCLQNMEAIHNMDLPKDLKIVYISMDRTKDKEKWTKKAQNLHLSNSYLFAETQNNKNIIKKINLNQIPRYILIDQDFNIINPDLATPQEADFLKELKSYIK